MSRRRRGIPSSCYDQITEITEASVMSTHLCPSANCPRKCVDIELVCIEQKSTIRLVLYLAVLMHQHLGSRFFSKE